MTVNENRRNKIVVTRMRCIVTPIFGLTLRPEVDWSNISKITILAVHFLTVTYILAGLAVQKSNLFRKIRFERWEH